MNVKIKARIAILTQYMTLLGFKNVSIKARLEGHTGGPVGYTGKDDLQLDRLDELRGTLKASLCSVLVITLKGYHTGLDQYLTVSRSVTLDYALERPEEFLSHTLRDAEDSIHAALYARAKAKAVIPASELL